MKRMASERKNSSSKDRSRSGKTATIGAAAGKKRSGENRQALPERSAHHYAVCVRNDGYLASLELRKLYRVLEDTFANQHDMIRVVDESGEDYLYPTEFFVALDLPASVAKVLGKIA